MRAGPHLRDLKRGHLDWPPLGRLSCLAARLTGRKPHLLKCLQAGACRGIWTLDPIRSENSFLYKRIKARHPSQPPPPHQRHPSPRCEKRVLPPHLKSGRTVTLRLQSLVCARVRNQARAGELSTGVSVQGEARGTIGDGVCRAIAPPLQHTRSRTMVRRGQSVGPARTWHTGGRTWLLRRGRRFVMSSRFQVWAAKPNCYAQEHIRCALP